MFWIINVLNASLLCKTVIDGIIIIWTIRKTNCNNSYPTCSPVLYCHLSLGCDSELLDCLFLCNHSIISTIKTERICLDPKLWCRVVARGLPEQSAEPQCGVRQDPSGQLPQSLFVQHWDVSCQAVAQQGHVTLFNHILHPTGDMRQQLYHALYTVGCHFL